MQIKTNYNINILPKDDFLLSSSENESKKIDTFATKTKNTKRNYNKKQKTQTKLRMKNKITNTTYFKGLKSSLKNMRETFNVWNMPHHEDWEPPKQYFKIHKCPSYTSSTSTTCKNKQTTKIQIKQDLAFKTQLSDKLSSDETETESSVDLLMIKQEQQQTKQKQQQPLTAVMQMTLYCQRKFFMNLNKITLTKLNTFCFDVSGTLRDKLGDLTLKYFKNLVNLKWKNKRLADKYEAYCLINYFKFIENINDKQEIDHVFQIKYLIQYTNVNNMPRGYYKLQKMLKQGVYAQYAYQHIAAVAHLFYLKEYLMNTIDNNITNENIYKRYFMNWPHILPIEWNFNKQTGFVTSIKLFDKNLNNQQKIAINYLISFGLLQYSNNKNNNNTNNNNTKNNNTNNNNNNIHMPLTMRFNGKNFVEYGYSTYIQSSMFKILPKLENTIKVIVQRRLNIYNAIQTRLKKNIIKLGINVNHTLFKQANMNDASDEITKILGDIKQEKAFLANNQIRICNSANYLIFAKFYFNSSYYWPNKNLDVNKQDNLGKISDTIRFYGWTNSDYKQINNEIDQIINHSKACESISRRKTYDILDIPYPGSTDTSCNAYNNFTGIGAHRDIESAMVKPQASITLLKCKKLTGGGEEGIHGSNAETSLNMIPGEIHHLQQESIGGLADTHRIQCEDVSELMFTLLPRIIRHTSYYSSLIVNIIQCNFKEQDLMYHFLMTLITFKHVFGEVKNLNEIYSVKSNDIEQLTITNVSKNIRQKMINVLKQWEERELKLFNYYKHAYENNYLQNSIIDKHECVTGDAIPAVDRFNTINDYCNKNNINFIVPNLK